MNGERPSEEQAQREMPKVEPGAEDLPKEGARRRSSAGENRRLIASVSASLRG